MSRGTLARAGAAAVLLSLSFVVGASGSGGATVPLLVLDRFDAVFDQPSHTTSYRATASSAENRIISFTWKLNYTGGRCGNFTVTGGNMQDLGSSQQATVPGILNADGYYISTAGYFHEGCTSTQERSQVLTLEIVRSDAPARCSLLFTQTARDGDSPPVPKESPPTTKEGTCDIEVRSPPKLSAAPPEIPKPDAKRWRLVQGLAISAAGTASSAALLLLVIPEPATKGGAAFMLVISVGALGLATFAEYMAKDPPDPNYKRLAKPVYPKVPLLRPGPGITKAEAAAANAWLTNSARMVGLDRAFITSFERAQGAYRARDAVWDKRQSDLAATHARALAKVLDARPALEATLRRALQSGGMARQLAAAKAADVEPATKLPRTTVSILRSFGLTKAQITAFEAKAAKASPSAVVPKSLASADRTGAGLLRAMAARLAKRY